MGSFAPLILMFIYLFILIFIGYFLISVLQFMRQKNKDDALLLQKMDELSKQLEELKKT